MEAVRRMSSRYDFVVTSGGIGPTSVYPNKPDYTCETSANMNLSLDTMISPTPQSQRHSTSSSNSTKPPSSA